MAAKQTAGNNKFLAGVKKHMNHKIYAQAAKILNADGQPAALLYLQQFFSKPLPAEYFTEFQGIGKRSEFFQDRPGEVVKLKEDVQ